MTIVNATSSPLGLPLDAHRSWGAIALPDGSTQFRIWAPRLASLRLELRSAGVNQSRTKAMSRSENGFFELNVADCPDGTRYRFELPDGRHRPDPASRF